MQIYVLDKDPNKSAKMLNDKLVRKMLVEQMQLLSTYLRTLGTDKAYFYKSIPQGKELVKWISNNLTWNMYYLDALMMQVISRNKNWREYKSILTANRFIEDFHEPFLNFYIPTIKDVSFRCKKEYSKYDELNKKLLPIEQGIKEYNEYYQWNIKQFKRQ